MARVIGGTASDVVPGKAVPKQRTTRVRSKKPAKTGARRATENERGERLVKDINIVAVLVAAGSSFLLGGLWYSRKLFGGAWGRASGRLVDGKAAEAGHPHPARVFVISFLFSLLAATAFAFALGPEPELGTAVWKGLVVGACFVAACFGINYQFAERKAVLRWIDGGYHTAQFVIFGVVLGLWR